MYSLTFRKSRFFVTFLFVFLLSLSAKASHIFGVDFYYSHVSGNTYKVYLVAYGDCSGSAFSTFATSTPQVKVYNGSTYFNQLNLSVLDPAGTEVTPVCPSQAGNTTCSNPSSTIPGIKKFVYAGNVTLPSTSATWRFVFTGIMSSTTSAGRSNSITNVMTGASGSVIQLTDTLNNTVYNNSSAQYTTIPTPFYCLNQPSTFNPGAVDANGDSLSYGLIPAVNATTGGNVTYISPYTAANPLGTAPGAFSMNAATGQMSFTPNIVQRALVVYNTREYKGGMLVGTSQREMTVVVLNTCSNTAPSGALSAATTGTISGGTQLNICGNKGAFNVQINPTDPEGDTITMTAAGLPSGATFNVVNNNTTAPHGTFSWNTTGVAPGNYIFYVTYQDRGCPMSAGQTIAYTIRVLPLPSISVSVSPPPCASSHTGSVTLLPSGGTSPYRYKVNGGAYTTSNVFGGWGPGTNTFFVQDSNGCTVDTSVTVTSLPPIHAGASVARPLCYGTSNGSVTLNPFGSVAPYTYAIGSGSFGTSNVFGSLANGAYTFHIRNANGCVLDTIILVSDSTHIHASVSIPSIPCAGGPVAVTVTGLGSPVGGYTYSTGFGASTFTPSGTFALPLGANMLRVRDSNHCQFDTIIHLLAPAAAVVTTTQVNVSCNGAANGSITVSATGGRPPYLYNISGGAFGSSPVFSPLGAGIYTVSVKDSAGCIVNRTVTITQPPALKIDSVAITGPSCLGPSAGSARIYAHGGTPPLLYAIGSGSYTSSPTFSSLPAGTYILHIKDANGCTKDTTITLVQPAAIAVAAAVVSPSCSGSGTVTLTASGGVPAYLYAMGSGAYASTPTFGPLAGGTYTFHVKDNAGCIKDTTISIVAPSSIVAHASVRSPLCSTLSNGQVSLSGTGGVPPYMYAMGIGSYSSSSVFSPLAAGSYVFHIKDARGCVKDTTIALADSTTVGATLSVSNILCHGDSAIVSLSGTGSAGGGYLYTSGSAPFTSSGTFSVTAGTYAMHVMDGYSCAFDTTITITQPAPLSVTTSASATLCSGSGGSMSVSATGGTPGYMYSLSGGPYGTSPVFSALAGGTYVVAVRDANGCTLYDTVTIVQPAAIVIDSIVLAHPLCHGNTNGSISVFAHGGGGTLTYALSSGAFFPTANITGLVSGTYIVHVRDVNGCIKDTTVTLVQPAAISLASTVVSPVCSTLGNGKITVMLAGGTPAYTYAIGSGAFGASSTFSPLAAGTYTVHAKDAHGCMRDTTITIADSLSISSSLTVSSSPCSGSMAGSISVAGLGGTSPYTYAIGSGSYGTSGAFTALAGGTYTVHVRDHNGCIKDTTAVISQPALLSMAIAVSEPTCFNLANGHVAVMGTGGTPGYQYSWNYAPYTASGSFGSVAAGVATIQVKDLNGCVHDTTFTITQPAPVSASVSLSDIRCHGDADGSIAVHAAGGTAPYMYAVNTSSFASSNTFNGLSDGVYNVHITDLKGCTHDTSVVVTEPAALQLTAAVTHPKCEGMGNGTVVLDASGGMPVYTYAIDHSTYRTDTVFNGLTSGVYTFHLKDAHGCVKDTTITLVNLEHIANDVTVSPATCYGGKNGGIVIHTTGGKAPLQYELNGYRTDNGRYDSLAAGKYVIVVTDSNNCRSSVSAEVRQPLELRITLDVKDNQCEEEGDQGAILASVRDGTAPYSYLWSNNPSLNNASNPGLGNGHYMLTVKDDHQCVATDTATIRYSACCRPFVPNAFTPNADGHNDIFRIAHKGDIQVLEFAVYNRFGERVFSAENSDIGWDGKYKGVSAELGVYNYFARIICGNDRSGKEVFLKGDVMLIR
jgi:gliding motility-associated-like protein